MRGAGPGPASHVKRTAPRTRLGSWRRAQGATLGRSTNVVVHREAAAFGTAVVTVVIAWCCQWRGEDHLEQIGSGPATARDVNGAIWHRCILHDVAIERRPHRVRRRAAREPNLPTRLVPLALLRRCSRSTLASKQSVDGQGRLWPGGPYRRCHSPMVARRRSDSW